MIKISKRAETYLNILINKKNQKTNLRISIQHPGTEYAECKISYDYNTIHPKDIEIKYSNFSIYLNREIVPYFKNSKIDLFKNNLEKQLMLIAPNAKESSIDHTNKNRKLFLKIQSFIESNINTQLSVHGGKITLLNITKSGYIIIKFSGGCNGCSMVDFTLKDGIEKQILKNFPILKGVKDITNHTRGNHSFF
ncbi:NifU family protein [Buchnera aphidicola]|uniref:NifU family protein n=1 Tax=Buchnera aphidicola TaxID=9 RepID=UPI003463C395